MTINFNSAMQAYKQAASVANNAAKTTAPDPTPIGRSAGGAFGNLLSSGVENTVNAIQNAENISSKALVKQADITNVVTAISNAELTLQAVVAVRDRLVQAHQDIVRMPI